MRVFYIWGAPYVPVWQGW